MHRLFIALLSSAALTALAQPAYAQDASAAEPSTPSPAKTQATASDTGDIIVTAQKRSERLNDVPLSINAIGGDQLTAQGVTSAADLTKVVPGFTYAASPYGSPLYTIRGIGFFDEAIGISPTVSVYVDQVPLAFTRMTEGAALDVERVEALKGPQGTLFGQNATGGAINYIAAKPTDTLKLGGNFTYGRFNTVNLEGYVSGPLADGLTARIAARIERSDDWQRSYTRFDTLGRRDFRTARLLVDWQPSSRLKFEFNANGWINRSDNQAKQYVAYTPGTPVTDPGFQPDSPGFPNFQADLRDYPKAPAGDNRAADWDEGVPLRKNDNFYQFSLRGDLDVSDRVILTSITSYAKLKVDSVGDEDGTDMPDHRMTKLGHASSFSQELRLSGTAGANDALKWMLGGNYQRDDILDDERLYFRGSNTGFSGQRFTGLVNLSNQKVDTKAAFGSIDYSLSSQFTLQASGRYTDQIRNFAGCLQDNGSGDLANAFAFLSTSLSGTPTTIAPGACVTLDPVTNKPMPIVRDRLPEHNFSWRLGASWKPNIDTLLYANVTKGYKSGSFGTLPAIRPAQLAPLKQEALLAYEVGFKLSTPGRMLQLTGAGFYYDYTDKQLLGFLDSGFPFGKLPAAVSVPKSRVLGAELDATIRPVAGLSLRIGGTFIDTKVTDHRIAFGPLGATIDLKGERFPTTPKWQVTSDVEYDFPVSADWSGFLGASLAYRSGTSAFFGAGKADAVRYGDPLLANFEMPGYALLDLRAGVETPGGKYRVQVWGRNVTNKYYVVFADRVNDTTFRQTGMPATYGVTVSLRY